MRYYSRSVGLAVLIIICVSFPFRTRGQLADSPWPSFANDAQNSGLSEYVGPSTDRLLWDFEVLGTIPSSPTIGQDGTVYFSSDSVVHAVNPDGTEKWRFKADAMFRRAVPTLGNNGTVYVMSENDSLYALNLDGSIKWTFGTSGNMDEKSVIGDDGTIYFNAGEALYALQPDGSLKWKYDNGYGMKASPAIGPDGTIYVASVDFHVRAITPDGSLKWEYRIEHTYLSTPAVDKDGNVYVGAGSEVFALYPNGTLKWKFRAKANTPAGLLRSPTVGPYGNIYVSGEGKTLFALDKGGNLKWKRVVEHRDRHSVTVGQAGHIYLGSHQPLDRANFYVFNTDGTLEWDEVIDGSVTTPAMGSQGRLYITASDHLYAFKSTNRQPEVFQVGTPNNGSVFEQKTLSFNWQATNDQDAGDVVTYKLQIKDSTGIIHEYDAGESTSMKVSPSLSNSTYYQWRVIAEDQHGNGTGNLNGFQKFGYDPDNIAPGPFSLQFPEQGKQLTERKPVFTWEKPEDPNLQEELSYRIYVATDSSFKNAHVWASDTNRVQPDSELKDDTRYFWYVEAMDEHGSTSITDTASFWINTGPTPPEAFNLISPDSAETGISQLAKLIWESTYDKDPVDTVRYSVKLAKNKNLTEGVHRFETGTDTSFTPRIMLDNNTRYYWSVTAIDKDSLQTSTDTLSFVVGTISDLTSKTDIPESYKLYKPYPNPFNPTTTIRYNLPEATEVTLQVFNLLGKHIATVVKKRQSAGRHAVKFDAGRLTSGTYIYRLKTESFRKSHKMLLLK